MHGQAAGLDMKHGLLRNLMTWHDTNRMLPPEQLQLALTQPIQSNLFTVVEPWKLRFQFLRLSALVQHPIHSSAPAAYIYRVAFVGLPDCPQNKFASINHLIEHTLQSPPACVCALLRLPLRVRQSHLNVAPLLRKLQVADQSSGSNQAAAPLCRRHDVDHSSHTIPNTCTSQHTAPQNLQRIRPAGIPIS